LLDTRKPSAGRDERHINDQRACARGLISRHHGKLFVSSLLIAGAPRRLALLLRLQPLLSLLSRTSLEAHSESGRIGNEYFNVKVGLNPVFRGFTFDRQWLALVLTSQVFLGAFLGIAAQAFLAIVVIFYILPWFGLGLLDTARDLEEFDLPMR
jgi:hypothetical protein